MSKENVKVIGFGTRRPAPDPEEKKEEKHEVSIEEEFVEVLLQRYVPALSIADSDEQKTSTDLFDEMEGMTDPDKNKLYLVMKLYGFKVHYTGDSFVWLLKERL